MVQAPSRSIQPTSVFKIPSYPPALDTTLTFVRLPNRFPDVETLQAREIDRAHTRATRSRRLPTRKPGQFRMRYGRNSQCQKVVKVQNLRNEMTCMDKSYIPEGRDKNEGASPITGAGDIDSNKKNKRRSKSRFAGSFPVHM